MTTSSDTLLTIDLDAVVGNYDTLRDAAGQADCAAVVKADAYGLGAGPVVRALLDAGCRDFFVAQFVEARRLRQTLGGAGRIYILHGVAEGEVCACAEAGFIPVLNSLAQCRAWAVTGGPASLQIDSGMSRWGLDAGELEQLLDDRALRDALDLRLVMSHLANADDPVHPGNAQQLARFAAARTQFPDVPASLANSAGIFLGQAFHFELCRAGAALYGLDCGPRAARLRSVVRLSSHIAQVRQVRSGTGIGYGFALVAERPMRLATVPVGYADGWMRSLYPGGQVSVGGRAAPIVGRVSMDSMIIDVTGLAEATEGSVVELIGPEQSPDAVARAAGTIGYEILTALGSRYRRSYEFSGGAA